MGVADLLVVYAIRNNDHTAELVCIRLVEFLHRLIYPVAKLRILVFICNAVDCTAQREIVTLRSAQIADVIRNSCNGIQFPLHPIAYQVLQNFRNRFPAVFRNGK